MQRVTKTSAQLRGSRSVPWNKYFVAARPTCHSQHLSYKQSLKDVHLPSALDQARFDDDIAVGVT